MPDPRQRTKRFRSNSIALQVASSKNLLSKTSSSPKSPLSSVTSSSVMSQRVRSLKRQTQLVTCDFSFHQSLIWQPMESLRFLKNLHHISLDFSYQRQLDDNRIFQLSKSLAILWNVSKLSLNFKLCESITDKAIVRLSRCISALTHMEDLSINLSSCSSITDKSLFALFNCLYRFKKLKVLRLTLEGCKLDNNTLAIMARSFSRLKHIQEIELDFSSSTGLKDDGLIALGKSLVNLNNLTQLNVNVRSCKNLTAASLVKFADYIGYLKSLQTLKLIAMHTSAANDEVLKTLGINLSKLTHLRALIIDFGSCIQVKNEGIIEFGNLMSELKVLKEIQFNVSCNPNVAEASVREFHRNLTKANEIISAEYYVGYIRVINSRNIDKFLCENN